MRQSRNTVLCSQKSHCYDEEDCLTGGKGRAHSRVNRAISTLLPLLPPGPSKKFQPLKKKLSQKLNSYLDLLAPFYSFEIYAI